MHIISLFVILYLRYLASDFSVAFDELLTVKIIEVPHCIELQVRDRTAKDKNTCNSFYAFLFDLLCPAKICPFLIMYLFFFLFFL